MLTPEQLLQRKKHLCGSDAAGGGKLTLEYPTIQIKNDLLESIQKSKEGRELKCLN